MKNKILHYTIFIFLLLVLLFNNQCVAQNIYLNGKIDKDTIVVGQPFNYELNMRIPQDYLIEWAEIKDTIGSQIELIDKSELVKTPINNSEDLKVSQTLTLTSFDTGYIEVPKIGIRYSKSINDSIKFMCYTDIMNIYVSPVAIDTTAAFRPIKAPMKQNITAKETLSYFGALILLAGIILMIFYFVKHSKKKKGEENEENKPKIPAIITAREKLGLLKNANLWQSGRLKEYYTDLIDIAREYLKGQFNVDAIEMTSDEILEEVKKIKLEDQTFSRLKDTFLKADLVKFAKAKPSPEQNETSFNDINYFVEDSYNLYQELEKKKAEEEKNKKHDVEVKKIIAENQETEDTQ